MGGGAVRAEAMRGGAPSMGNGALIYEAIR